MTVFVKWFLELLVPQAEDSPHTQGHGCSLDVCKLSGKPAWHQLSALWSEIKDASFESGRSISP